MIKLNSYNDLKEYIKYSTEPLEDIKNKEIAIISLEFIKDNKPLDITFDFNFKCSEIISQLDISLTKKTLRTQYEIKAKDLYFNYEMNDNVDIYAENLYCNKQCKFRTVEVVKSIECKELFFSGGIKCKNIIGENISTLTLECENIKADSLICFHQTKIKNITADSITTTPNFKK